MRVGAMILLATLSAVSLTAYLLLGNGQFLANLIANPASVWGPIRFGCLLIDYASVIALTILLLLSKFRDELINNPAACVIVIAVWVVNGLFLVVFTGLLFRFLSAG